MYNIYAIARFHYEPGQDRKVAAISSKGLCDGVLLKKKGARR